MLRTALAPLLCLLALFSAGCRRHVAPDDPNVCTPPLDASPPELGDVRIVRLVAEDLLTGIPGARLRWREQGETRTDGHGFARLPVSVMCPALRLPDRTHAHADVRLLPMCTLTPPSAEGADALEGCDLSCDRFVLGAACGVRTGSVTFGLPEVPSTLLGVNMEAALVDELREQYGPVAEAERVDYTDAEGRSHAMARLVHGVVPNLVEARILPIGDAERRPRVIVCTEPLLDDTPRRCDAIIDALVRRTAQWPAGMRLPTAP